MLDDEEFGMLLIVIGLAAIGGWVVGFLLIACGIYIMFKPKNELDD